LFDERIKDFEDKLDKHKKTVEASLKADLDKSRQELVEHFLPLVEKNPPNALLGQIATGKPNRKQIAAWLEDELRGVFPEPSDLLSEMDLDVQFKDVTYETLTEDGFAEKLRKAYPHVDWDKPFAEFDAARARDSASANDER
jgi:hypothetical protein